MHWLLIIPAIVGFLDLGTKFLLAFGSRKKGHTQSAHHPPLTVIIAARNEEKNLPGLLSDLISQHYSGEKNILIVLDRCTDQSKAIVQQFPEVQYIEIHEVPEGFSPKKYALTQGIQAAQSEWIVFTDADCRMGPDWLSHISASISTQSEIILGLGAYRKERGILNLWVRFETWWTAMQYIGLAGMGVPYMGVGRNLAYKKQLFVKQNGFSGHETRLSGDDDLFINQVATARNTKAMISWGSETISAAPSNWKAWWRQKTRHFSAGTAYRGRARIILPLINGLQPLFFLSLLVAGVATGNWAFLLLIAGIRWTLTGISLAIFRPPLFETTFLWVFPFLDMMLMLHFLIVAPAGFVLHPQWKAD